MSEQLNRVRFTSATTGTGSSVAFGAVFSAAYLSPTEAGAVDGHRYTYVIQQANNIEIQQNQVWTASGTTIARGTPTFSKISGTAGTTQITLDGTEVVAFGASAADLMFGQTQAAAIASGTTTDIWNISGNSAHVTGTTTITGFGTAPTAGLIRWIIFDGALTLTHNGSTLVLPGAANITTAANDRALVYSDTTTKAVVIAYVKAGIIFPASGTLARISGESFSAIAALALRDTSAAFDVTVAATSTSATLTAGCILTLDMGNVAHTVKFGTTANTITFPNTSSDTVAMLAVANTFSGVNTFSNTTASTTPTTGGALFGGGVGIVGQVSANNLSLSGSANALAGLLDFSHTSAIGDASALTSSYAITISGDYLLFVVSEYAVGGQSALYIGSNTVPFLVYSTGVAWVAPTATPASGCSSVYRSGGVFKIFNNQSTAARYKVASFRIA